MEGGIAFGYLGINEVHPPGEMVELAVVAERCGWDSVWLSDHFHPWTNAGTNCNFCWVTLTAAGERTERVRIGAGVTVPGQRYHPAIIAQAFATLASLYPNRIVLGLGSGEAINEMAVGSEWPPVAQRLERLEEGVKVIRLLLGGEFIDFTGKYFKLSTARLYTRPAKPIPIYMSAGGPKAAKIAGRYADGIIVPLNLATTDVLREKMMPAIREGARETGRDPDAIKVATQTFVSYDEDERKALTGPQREYWNHTALPRLFEVATSDPRIIQERCKVIDDKAFLRYWMVETTPEAYIKRMEAFVKMDVDEILILSASPDEGKFLRVFGEHVLPYLRDLRGA